MSELLLLSITAVSIGFIHTVIGPDHYIPFVAMARARGWSAAKMIRITVICGVGHVAGSVVLGLVGLALGLLVVQLEEIESARGDTAAWLLIAFGFTYLAWGLIRAVRNTPHTHHHAHADGTIHSHEHVHDVEHMHVHEPAAGNGAAVPGKPDSDGRSVTAWVLFIVFVLGPCEPLIPLLIWPGAKMSMFAVAVVVLAFGVATILTMSCCALALYHTSASLSRLGLDLHRYAHVFAGSAVLICGLLIKSGF